MSAPQVSETGVPTPLALRADLVFLAFIRSALKSSLANGSGFWVPKNFRSGWFPAPQERQCQKTTCRGQPPSLRATSPQQGELISFVESSSQSLSLLIFTEKWLKFFASASLFESGRARDAGVVGAERMASTFLFWITTVRFNL